MVYTAYSISMMYTAYSISMMYTAYSMSMVYTAYSISMVYTAYSISMVYTAYSMSMVDIAFSIYPPPLNSTNRQDGLTSPIVPVAVFSLLISKTRTCYHWMRFFQRIRRPEEF